MHILWFKGFASEGWKIQKCYNQKKVLFVNHTKITKTICVNKIYKANEMIFWKQKPWWSIVTSMWWDNLETIW